MEEGLYPGIDLVYYGSGAGMEYDFVVAPGSDPGRIRMRVGGAQKLLLNADGDLVVRTASGNLVQHRPVIYQTVQGSRRMVDGGFAIARDQVWFRVGRYDRSLPLTIDPQISFSSFLGDFDEDVALSVAVDNAGNTYVAGYSTSNDFGGDQDVMVASIDPTGKTLNYIAQASGSFGIGGSSDDVANGLAVDGYGSAVIVGSTTSADFPTTQNSFQPTGGGGDYDAFLMRLDPTGQNLIYATYLGGSGDDEAWSVKIDATGNTYLTGDTTSNDFPATTGVYRTTNSGATDGFIAKFDNGGNRIWATYFGGNSDENSYAIAIDPAGNSYVTGFTDSGNFPTQNAFQGTYRGGDDAFVLKLNSSGTQLVYSTFLGGTGDEQGIGIALDPSLNAYVTGATSSQGFPTTSGAPVYQGGDSDMFVTKLAPDGHSLAYSTLIGSHGTDQAWGIAVDVAGNAYVVGDTDSDQFPVSGDAQQKSRKGGLEGTITELRPDGMGMIYSSFLGGSSDDSVQAISLDAAGTVYLVGYTSSDDFPLTSGVFQSDPGGGSADAFVVKYSFPTVGPAVTSNGVVNGASFASGPVAPGSIVSIFGNNFANAGVNAQSIPLSTSLGSVSVSINGVAAPLFFVSPTQINAQVPMEVQAGPATAVVKNPAGSSAQAAFTVAAAAPGVFTNGTQAVVQNADGSINSSSAPASAGSVVTVYLTGIGPVDNAVATGAAASSNPVSSATMRSSATINGVPATTQFVGLTPGSVGLAQANVVIPSGVSGNLPLLISIGGVTSNGATISVR